ncbi:MAG TPA: peptidylprolyl isomerase, partial [Candidatus Sulfotelmatobacter sp.]|nr:peptidylprolyl isomerase [Candidatus Sulfotelmatobacter sp.]
MFIAKLTKPCVLLAMAGALSTGPVLAETAAGTNAAAKPAAKATDLFADSVVAKGKGVQVNRSQLDEAVISIKSSVAARGQSLPPEQLKMMEQQVLDRLIQIQLLAAKANDADKAKGNAVWTNTLERLKTRAGNDETLNRQLKAVGMTQDELRTKLTEEATAQAALEREMKITVSDDEVKKFYDENPSKFEQPEMIRASHILLSTRDMESGKELSAEQKAAKKKKAEELLARARKGEDFAKLAKEFSEDPGSKDNGGEYKFPRG